MESKKDVAVALSTSGRAISWRRAESKHVLPHARPRKKVCDQRGGGGVREQRRHRHAVWGGKEEIVCGVHRIGGLCKMQEMHFAAKGREKVRAIREETERESTNIYAGIFRAR